MQSVIRILRIEYGRSRSRQMWKQIDICIFLYRGNPFSLLVYFNNLGRFSHNRFESFERVVRG